MYPNEQDWLWVQVMSSQAFLGCISPNFRQIIISYDNGKWVITTTLQVDSEEDREEIFDAVDEFGVYLEDIRDRVSSCVYAEASAVVELESGDLYMRLGNHERAIYRRRE